MIKRWVITGDTHGQVESRLRDIIRNMDDIVLEETAVVILGDAGINYFLNKRDRHNKQLISALGVRVYCVRGNHEERPENISGMKMVHDEDVGNAVYMEEEFPMIRYLIDGAAYSIDGHSVLVIGGAYSIDKYYRLASEAGGGYGGWFKDEQLSKGEMAFISEEIAGKHFDLVFTHTAPIDWEPTDLFLGGIDQSNVDKTMEKWLGGLKDKFTWGLWLFGHYHADRIEAPHVEQFYMEYEDLNDVINRWKKYDDGWVLDWWIPKSPRME